MSHAATDAHAAHDDAHHHGPQGVGIYVSVAVALVFLTSLSYVTNLPVWDAVVGDSVAIKRIWMMGVSCTKAMLVIMFFMHLKWEANWKWVLTIPASLMSLFLVLMLVPDVGKRMEHASYERLKYAAELTPEEADEVEDEGEIYHTDGDH
ncbi:MAG: hypothetical protein CMJ58_07955 [Planctomycetaceae bacterium]|nr:hypothetical protein [Planctomycetaceae bacterium]